MSKHGSVIFWWLQFTKRDILTIFVSRFWTHSKFCFKQTSKGCQWRFSHFIFQVEILINLSRKKYSTWTYTSNFKSIKSNLYFTQFIHLKLIKCTKNSFEIEWTTSFLSIILSYKCGVEIRYDFRARCHTHERKNRQKNPKNMSNFLVNNM